jgi:hypothetical protein
MEVKMEVKMDRNDIMSLVCPLIFLLVIVGCILAGILGGSSYDDPEQDGD